MEPGTNVTISIARASPWNLRYYSSSFDRMCGGCRRVTVASPRRYWLPPKTKVWRFHDAYKRGIPQTQTGSIISSSKEVVSKNFTTMANSTRTFAKNGWHDIDLTELEQVMNRQGVRESDMVERENPLWDDLTAVNGPNVEPTVRFSHLAIPNGLP